MVDVPYLVLEPTHNKQDFADGKVHESREPLSDSVPLKVVLVLSPIYSNIIARLAEEHYWNFLIHRKHAVHRVGGLFTLRILLSLATLSYSDKMGNSFRTELSTKKLWTVNNNWLTSSPPTAQWQFKIKQSRSHQLSTGRRVSGGSLLYLFQPVKQ